MVYDTGAVSGERGSEKCEWLTVGDEIDLDLRARGEQKEFGDTGCGDYLGGARYAHIVSDACDGHRAGMIERDVVEGVVLVVGLGG